MPAL
jgi:hypothetical protein